MRVVKLAGDVILVTMNSEENNFGTVIIDGETWAVTPGNENDNMVVGNSSTPDADTMVVGDEDSIVPPATETNESNTEAIAAESLDEAAADLDDAAVSAGEDETAEPETAEPETAEPETAEPEFDALRALTALLLGGAIEGTSQLVSRLEQYEEELRKQAAEREQDADAVAVQENEMDRLRYAFVGFVLDAQSTLKRNVSLWARVVDSSVRATNRVASPVSSRLSGPFQRRYDRLVRRGEQSLSRWIADGRTSEPQSRELAKMTYHQIVDEFINQLAENPELQDLVTQQGLGLASEARDEVRERTVTADNLVESLARRILRRTPRAELPGPPPEVQRWGSMTLEEIKEVDLRSKKPKS